MSKIKNGGLDQYGAELFEQQQIGTAGVERVNNLKSEIKTSNVTTVKEVRSASARLLVGTWRPWRVLLQHSIMLRLFCIVDCGIARFRCDMRVFEVHASFSPLGYLCVKFHFFRGLHCCASPWRKIAYSITHSLAQLI